MSAGDSLAEYLRKARGEPKRARRDVGAFQQRIQWKSIGRYSLTYLDESTGVTYLTVIRHLGNSSA